jgi:hypothetical protein
MIQLSCLRMSTLNFGKEEIRICNPHIVKKAATSPRSQTDWKRVDSMKDSDIDFTDLPEILPERFATTLIRQGLKPVAGAGAGDGASSEIGQEARTQG